MYPTGSDGQHTLLAVWNTKPTVLTAIIILLLLLRALATTFYLQLLSGLFNCERVGAGERGLFDDDGKRTRSFESSPTVTFTT